MPLAGKSEDGGLKRDLPNLAPALVGRKAIVCVPQLSRRPRRTKIAHRFRVGRSIFLQATLFNRDAARGAYEVIAQLPEKDGQLEYRIKSRGEPHERVAKESDLHSE